MHALARRLLDGAPRRATGGLLALLVALTALPFAADRLPGGDVWITMLFLIFYFAYVGQAWNVLMGFAGQLSLGHALYIGLGSYVSAALFFHWSLNPWLGAVVAVAVSTAMGLLIGFLAFRFSLTGVYFALLTIAFAEFTRIAFDHWAWVGGSSGLFLKVESHTVASPLTLRGSPVMFYYVMLALAAAAFVVCRWLLTSRLGRYWIAIREDPEAAQAIGVDVFRCKMAAIAISSAMTALAGVVYAFFYNNLFPETTFAMGRSIELMLAPIVGGLGTLFGPILGAFLLVPLGEVLTDVVGKLGATYNLKLAGLKQILYGVVLLIIVIRLPTGVWPWIARRFGFDRREGDDA
jgi:branched-chain amino acid transport system permease protein